jgi:hypothetical protein
MCLVRFPIQSLSKEPIPPLSFEAAAPECDPPQSTKLPLELLHSIALRLPLSNIIMFATVNKEMYKWLLGSCSTRDVLARIYMQRSARWCLPHGEAETQWWNERNGDDALGWEYMKRCWIGSYSMRNRRRIWRACESIEEEYESKAKAVGQLVPLFI